MSFLALNITLTRFPCEITNTNQHYNCKISDYNGNYVCDYKNVGFDLNKVIVSKGMEDPLVVSGRDELAEYPKYEKGAFLGKDSLDNVSAITNEVPEFRNLEVGFKIYDGRYVGLINSYKVVRKMEAPTVKGTTMALTRHNYANPWWTINEIFSVWLLGIEHVDNIVFLDGHAKSSMDEIWSFAFKGKCTLIKKLKSPVIFEHLLLVSHGLGLNSPLSPDYKGGNVNNSCDSKVFSQFVNFMLRNVEDVKTKK